MLLFNKFLYCGNLYTSQRVIRRVSNGWQYKSHGINRSQPTIPSESTFAQKKCFEY